MKSSLVLVLCILSIELFAQSDLRITENFENVSLSKVLKKFRSEYNLKIAYDNQLVQDIKVTQKLAGLTVEESLQKILEGTNLTHKQINGKIILIPNQQTDVLSSKPITFLSGVIKDQDSGETLPNATVRISGTDKGVISNTDGHFTILEIPSDSGSLIVNYLGYRLQKIKLSEIQNSSNMLIRLKSEQTLLDEVVVTDDLESPLEVQEKISRVAFNPRALSSLPSLASQDLFRTLQLMPGVSSTNETSSGLVIRGSIPSQNLILLDGFTVYHLDHFFGVFSGINADYIKDVQIFKGGFDAKYGGRVAGVVDITGRTGNTNKPKFNFGANLVSINGTADVPLSKKLTLLFSFRRAYTDVIQSSLYRNLFATARDTDEQIKRPVEIPEMKDVQPQFYFYDVNSKITFRPTSKDNISLSIYGGKDDLSGARDTAFSIASSSLYFEEDIAENSEWGNGGLSLRWGRQWNEKFYSNLKISGSNFFRTYNFKYRFYLETPDSTEDAQFRFRQNNELSDSNFALDNEWIINDKVSLDFGFSGMEYNVSNITNVNGQEADSTVSKSNIGSIYTTAKVAVTKKFTATFGMRLNYHQSDDLMYNEPRVSLSYKFSDKLNLKSAIGRYYQFVNQIQYDDPYNGIQNFWALSIAGGVPVAQSNHYVIGATFKKGDFLFDVEAYYKTLNGVVEFNLVPYLVEEGNVNSELFLLGEGRMRGIDFLIQKETGKHKAWLAYSWSRSLNSYPAIQKGVYYPSMYDQPHEIKLVNMLTLSKWHLSSTWVYGSGRPFPEYEILYFKNSSNHIYDLAVARDRTNFRRLPDYHRLDLSAAYNFTIGKFSGQAGLSIFNLYNRQNIKTRRLSIPALQRTLGGTEEPAPVYRDLILIGFTPSFFVNIGF